MKSRIVSYLKFFIKVRIINALRAFFLFLLESVVNVERWDRRMLIINLQGIGDLVVFTSVLKHYKKAFPEKKIFLLLKDNLGMDEILGKFVDEVIGLDYKKFVFNPFYGVKFINRLRRIGFKTVIAHDHSAAEIIGKMIAVDLGAKNVVGYEGFHLNFEKPFDINMAKNIRFAVRYLYPQFTTLIPSIDKDNPGSALKNVIFHYFAVYERLTGRKENDYTTQIILKSDYRDLFKKLNLKKNRYVILNLGSSQAWKNWPVERFIAVSSIFEKGDMAIVIIGAPQEKELGRNFRKSYRGKCFDLIGKTTVLESAVLIRDCFLVLSNDTSAVHLAVAFKKPSVCILGGGLFGLISSYGYPDINIWVYKDNLPCLFDDWQCVHKASKGRPTACIDAIIVEDVFSELKKLIDHLKNHPDAPVENFSPSFFK